MIAPVERTVFAIGVLLRLYLTAVNAEANDDHLAVVRIIADEHRLPRLREAWEGFQPKLYHASVALLWNLSPWQSSAIQVRLAQLVACAAGIATLFVVRQALRRHAFSPSIRTIAFALIALNPTLIGLNAQATNDSFVIFFGVLAVDRACQFFRTGARPAFVGMTAAVVLAALSKGNGLVLFVAIAATLLHALVRADRVPHVPRSQLARLAAGFVGVFLVATAAFGAYRANWEDTGNPFAINGERAPMPSLIERTYVYRPGATSIADTYFTFRFVDLLENPAITNDPVVYPLHRTSLWSQLYGRAHVAHFAQHPPSWKNETPLVVAIARLILLVALLPTAILVVGTARGVVGLMARWKGPGRPIGEQLASELLALVALGFVAFIVVYSLSYRDFSTMKAEFLFPGMLAYVFFFADEAERWMPRLRGVGLGTFGVLLALYVADVLILAIQLT